jgi:hypothetical protein
MPNYRNSPIRIKKIEENKEKLKEIELEEKKYPINLFV